MIFWGVVVEEEGEEVITRNRMLTRANASGRRKQKRVCWKSTFLAFKPRSWQPQRTQQPRPQRQGQLGVSLLVLLENLESLVDLGVKGLALLEKVEELSDGELEDHTRELTGELRLAGGNLGVDGLTEHLLLLLGAGLGKRSSGQGTG